jgi:virginiamycin A acetyltransferase
MRRLLLRCADAAAIALVFPAYVSYRLGCLIMGAERAFPGWSQAISLIPGLTGVYLRRAFYRLTLDRCELGAWVGFGTIFSHPWAEIGRNVHTGAYCSLGDVNLGDDTLLGSHVSVINGGGQHGIDRLDIPIRDQPGAYPKVRIGRDVWIGERSVVIADVGDHCVIGAGSVVTRPLPDYAIAVGSPARIVRYREGAPVLESRENAWASLAAVGDIPEVKDAP